MGVAQEASESPDCRWGTTRIFCSVLLLTFLALRPRKSWGGHRGPRIPCLSIKKTTSPQQPHS